MGIQPHSSILLALLILFLVVLCAAADPQWPSSDGEGGRGGSPHRRPAFFQLLEDTDEPNATTNISTTAAQNTTDLGESPLHALPLAADLLLSMNSASAFISLMSAVVNPALCTQSSRINLILKLSECHFSDLEDIAPADYPVQVGFGGDPAQKYFAALVLVWPFAGVLIGIHFLVVRMKSESSDHEHVEKSARALRFPSLSATALMLFFWQPMTMSSVTVLTRGQNQWMRFLCFGGLVAALAISSFAVRWYWNHMKFTEFLSAAELRERLLYEAEEEIRNKEEKERKEQEEARKRLLEEQGIEEPEVRPVLSLGRRKSSKKLAEQRKDAEIEEAAVRETTAIQISAKVRASKSILQIPLRGNEVTDQTNCYEKTFTSAGQWADKRVMSDKGVLAESPFKGFVDKYGYFYMKFKPKREWFFIAEFLVCTMFGFLEGFRPLTLSGCWNSAIVYVCTLGIYILLLGVLSPYVTLWDNISFCVLSATQLLSMLFIVIDIKQAVNLNNANSTDANGDFVQYDSLRNFSIDLLQGNMTAEQSSDIRQAADFMAFVCFSITVAKGLFDILLILVVYNRRKRRLLQGANGGDGKGSDDGDALLALPISHRGNDIDDDDVIQNGKLGRKGSRKKPPAFVDPDADDAEAPLLTAKLSALNLRDMKGGGKRMPRKQQQHALAEEEEEEEGGEQAQQPQRGKRKGGGARRNAVAEAEAADEEMHPAGKGSAARKGRLHKPQDDAQQHEGEGGKKKSRRGRRGGGNDGLNVDF